MYLYRLDQVLVKGLNAGLHLSQAGHSIFPLQGQDREAQLLQAIPDDWEDAAVEVAELDTLVDHPLNLPVPSQLMTFLPFAFCSSMS